MLTGMLYWSVVEHAEMSAQEMQHILVRLDRHDDQDYTGDLRA